MSTGMAAERHDWGWRLFRDNKIVDIVKIAKAKGDT
jgi:hypothetical protein